MTSQMIDRAIKKASQSNCRYKISAMGYDKRGNFIGCTFNHPRFDHPGGGIHAEMLLMSRYKSNLKTIIICRTNSTGDLLPIDPCTACKNKADDLGVKIISIK